jgi:transglutaminase-like putative cysteine protease
MLLSIHHSTTYRYRRAVRFGPHRLMVRAIEGHDVQIRRSGLTVQPTARVRWLRDVYDNSVAVADFKEAASELVVGSTLVVEQYNTNPFDFVLEPQALELPFDYRQDERADVQAFLERGYLSDEDALRQWVRPFLSASGRAKTVEFFSALGRSVPLFFQYARREEPGVQSPGETLKRRAGSCRDFALLFMESARMLGVAARYVSGYLCRADEAGTIGEASDATHAWAELYLPGAGWKGYDPTCGILAADYHVRVAVARWPEQAVPVSGSFSGQAADYGGMAVTVDARAVKSEGVVSQEGSNDG